jgi:hypothetical protein
MSRRLLITSAIATGSIAVITGCSSSGSAPASTGAPPAASRPLSTPAYKLQLHAVAVQESQAQQSVQAAFRAKSVAKIRTLLSTFATDQSSAAQRLEGLTPPPNAAVANAQLAKAFNDNAAAIQTLIAKLAHAKTPKQALQIVQGDKAAQRVGGEIDAALNKLKKLGYTTGS